MSENLYQPPSAPITGTAYSGDGAIPAAAITHLTGTQPWAGLSGIVMLTLAIAYIGFALYVLSLASHYNSAVVPALVVTFGAGYLFIHPLVRLCKFGSAINRLRISQNQMDFEEALRQQRLFWRFVGILSLVFLILIGIGLLITLSRPSSRY